MSEAHSAETKKALFEYLLRLGDDRLIIRQRLSEWCGHGPVLEEDIALTNIALDCVGQTEILLGLAGDVEGEGRDADKLAYFRDEYEFRNCQLVEQPRGDFADTIMRQFLYDAFAWPLLEALTKSDWKPLAEYAAKAVKETVYHLRHSREWVLRLGDGTEESHRRIQDSLNRYWHLAGELFYRDEVDTHLEAEGILPNTDEIEAKWQEIVNQTIAEATLSKPEAPKHMPTDARQGKHSEHLGHLLSNMQILARSHPGAEW